MHVTLSILVLLLLLLLYHLLLLVHLVEASVDFGVICDKRELLGKAAFIFMLHKLIVLLLLLVLDQGLLRLVQVLFIIRVLMIRHVGRVLAK